MGQKGELVGFRTLAQTPAHTLWYSTTYEAEGRVLQVQALLRRVLESLQGVDGLAAAGSCGPSGCATRALRRLVAMLANCLPSGRGTAAARHLVRLMTSASETEPADTAVLLCAPRRTHVSLC